ncbi:MAG: hypothetical protein IPJ41_08020 [Phycisphaerales bacterium]|nr:hypothetical protein [Phycisphaerales bacterium]
MKPRRHRIAVLLAALAAPIAAADGLRVATWNISLYAGGRNAAIQTAVYGQFEGRSMAPDVIMLQEMTSAAALQQIVTILNTAPGSPGDWASGPFIDGPDSDNGFVYRTSKVEFLGAVVVAHGGAAPNHPRDLDRYDARLIGYSSDEGLISFYSSHMKAGSASDDQQRRLLECQEIRADAAALSPPRHFILGGDFNTQSSQQASYIELTGLQSDNTGRLLDPISTPGAWNNNGSFRFVHTQDPVGAGGMDDRHDQVLIAYTLADGEGVDYIGNPAIPYSTEAWDDANHSYRSWGNDGTSFNLTLTTDGNTMVGAAIAEALKTVCAGAGHLPVFLDLRVPAKATADTLLDFGTINVGDEASLVLHAGNAGDVALWGPAGIGELLYALDAPAPFATDAGPFADDAGGQLNEHTVTLDTSTPGEFEATLLLVSNDPDAPSLPVTLHANVVGACLPDWNTDGTVNTLDFLAYLNSWTAQDPSADLNGDGAVNTLDFLEFLTAWAAGC